MQSLKDSLKTSAMRFCQILLPPFGDELSPLHCEFQAAYGVFKHASERQAIQAMC
jgi:hypothetical protein